MINKKTYSKRGTPTWGLCDCGVEHTEINQGVGGHEEIGQQSGHKVEIGYLNQTLN